ncbi:type II secretion system F family protein [Botrimarina mediterranea]|uniref:Type IV pilin biogenesis protein n=1 Tax=Botrimarina mediterranea TaxID=2528022 RepID=A0A518K960_9BACT|nr:type II secretion system F family protein [Botrimarina mediterranea]QDV74331.1 type IV pilin biogenesis protein [Botrimarina mediterranea]QDV78925.1 type IV pilin biogenesis protein [Planctomycetes bacterium K2D]
MPKRATLEELIAVNAEILALTRGGLPLAPTLSQAAGMLKGADSIKARLGESIQAGQTLGEAIEADGALPRYYAALVRAGEACGQLPAALQELSDALTRSLQLRRTCVMAAGYPVFVAVAAWTLLLFSSQTLLPEYDWITASPAGNPDAEMRRVVMGAFLYGGPILLGVLVLWVVARGGPDGGVLAAPLGSAANLPGVRNVLRLTAASTYCRLLTLMLKQRTSLPVALELAAEATGWPRYLGPSKRLAEAIRQGNAVSDEGDALKQLPPLVRSAVAMQGDAAVLSEAIDQAASSYEERASLAADTTAVMLPVISSAVLGGSAVVIYAVLMLWPYIQSLKEMAGWF